jgi:Lysophospholipase
MVFVPGTSVYALLYVEFMYKLSREGFNVVGVDPRGHGMSSGKRGVYTLGELVEDALAAVDHARSLYGGRVAVSGSSQGGMVAFYCAGTELEFVIMVIAVSCVKLLSAHNSTQHTSRKHKV